MPPPRNSSSSYLLTRALGGFCSAIDVPSNGTLQCNQKHPGRHGLKVLLPRHRYYTFQPGQELLAEHRRAGGPHAEIVSQRLSVDLCRLLIAARRDAPAEHAARRLIRVGEETEYCPGSVIGLGLLRETSAHQFQIQFEIPRARSRPHKRMLRAAL